MSAEMFIKIGDVKGEARGKGHEEEIDVLSWSWGVQQSGSMHVGGGGGAGKVNVQDLVITKRIDKSSPVLMLHSCKGTHIPEALLSVRKAGGKQDDYLTIKMEKVLLTSVAPSGTEADDGIEQVALNFEKVSYDYKPQKDDGTLDAASSLVWNVPEASDE
jgi:type VI secretion system secreted protein Hcp